MSEFNIARFSKEDQDKVNVDLAASGVAYKERMNQPVVSEIVKREQPEQLRQYFDERLKHYRKVATQLPNGNDPKYALMAEANKK
ncbi:DNA polymerase III subunit theta [Cedecea sp. P7760]|uniref:DNA polymerase III subunit theta n=1 Tax=Cedecea sp. P7760 TaxID=2726983 RepID=UPI00159F79B6|nr:DNA polymerase III subunit theta [Cedecea sp. P7760]NWC63989.1 DNA polymerase III subunit theta [Cedecea sp. P7760]